MDRLAVVGVSHMRGGAEALEHWQQNFTPDVIKQKKLPEYVNIATCNRWDLTLVLPEEANPESISRISKEFQPTSTSAKPYVYVGDAALEHITRVASSLDSLNPGEDQIMNQVRQAYQVAKETGTLGNTTAFAFETAMRIAKKVRREVGISPMETSLFSLAIPSIKQHLDHSAHVAVLGAGKMGALATKSLVDLGYKVTVVNRSIGRAQELAEPFNLEVMTLDTFMNTQDTNVDALVCATPVKNLIRQDFVKDYNKLKVIVDLGIPRNVVPELASQLCLLNVDTLQEAGQARRTELEEKLQQADQVIEVELQEALALWNEKLVGPYIRQMRESYKQTLLEVLPEQDVNKVLGRLLHGPIKGIRAVAREHGFEAAKCYFEDLQLSDKL